jgi:simple sugar transport system ATP-binding protein
MGESENSYAIQMQGVTKRFPGVVANKAVDLSVETGHVHALLGENGAGKSTLMNVLAGLYQQDEGQICIFGEPVDIQSPKDAIELGIGMVHQHFMLVESLTVAENVILGLYPTGLVINKRKVKQELRDLADSYHLNVDLDAYIWQLSVGEQQRVEILKLLYRGAKILILDEPTAVLTPQEADQLINILHKMASEGKTIIFITHKLHEVMDFSDRVSVLRDGEMIDTRVTSQTTKNELAKLMVGREVLFNFQERAHERGDVVLKVENLKALSDKGLPALKGVSFEVRAGEIVAVAGVAGNGQRELAEAITGLRRVQDGKIWIRGKDITKESPWQVIKAGLSHIPGDRIGRGLVPNLPISDNLVMKVYRKPPISNGPFIDYQRVEGFSERLVDAFNIITPSVKTNARLLSGGNQQKVVLAREIDASSGALVAVNPSRGLDIGATEAVRKTLLEQRDQGAAILLISGELEEVMQLADRILVIYEGEFMGELGREEAAVEEIGLMMAGEKRERRTDEISQSSGGQ